MPDTDLVTPLDASQGAPAAPAAASTPETEQSSPSAAPALPPTLLKIPAMQALVAGTPPAVSAPIKEFGKREEAKKIVENKDALTQAGFGFYRSLSGQIGVIFNQLHIHPEDILAADKVGRLTEIAPSFDAVNDEVAKSGAKNPVLLRTEVPNAPANATAKAPPQLGATLAPGAAPVPQAPAAVQRRLASARLQAMNPGAPTSGPAPGAGRLLNQILKPVV